MTQYNPSQKSPSLKPKRSLSSLRDAALLAAGQRALKRLQGGAISVTGPSGRQAVMGQGDVQARIALKSLKPLWQSVSRGGLGFAESYLDGDVETEDLGGLMRFYAGQYDVLSASGRGVFEVRGADKAWHRGRSNTREGSRSNIHAHYDLGNSFYKLWLDPGMTYSSALYQSTSDDLSVAQDAKYNKILEALRLEPGDSLLEIGCGWGGMAERSALTGATVKGITISNEQLDYARRRLQSAGLSSQAEVAFTDYRDVTGRYDHIVSIEMIEAVGEEHWPSYFATLRERLQPGGAAVVQAITIREEDFSLYSKRPDFIQRYIFPGGMLPTPEILKHQADKAGLTFETVERFGQSYAQTLRVWRDRFFAAWPEISALGFDDRFQRMWDYYLTYCEVGFERGYTDVGIYRFRRVGE
jgi:cyclopropane-fatty-acyl-phospholipid synthase